MINYPNANFGVRIKILRKSVSNQISNPLWYRCVIRDIDTAQFFWFKCLSFIQKVGNAHRYSSADDHALFLLDIFWHDLTDRLGQSVVI